MVKSSHLLGILIVLLAIAAACGSGIRLTEISADSSPTTVDSNSEVRILKSNQPIPDQSKILAQLTIKPRRVHCTCQSAWMEAELEARKLGGNAIQVNRSFGGECVGLEATILKIPEAGLSGIKKPDSDIDPNIALLKVYRKPGAGALVSYNLRMGDSVLCRVANNFETTIPLREFGKTTFWAHTEARSEVQMDIQPGHVYYIKCSVTMGAFVGHPHLEKVDSDYAPYCN